MAPYKTPEYHPAFEEYCETIFELKEDAVDVIQARIAERLEVSRPAVSEMIKRMEHEGLVAVDGAASVAEVEQPERRHCRGLGFRWRVLGLGPWGRGQQQRRLR